MRGGIDLVETRIRCVQARAVRMGHEEVVKRSGCVQAQQRGCRQAMGMQAYLKEGRT